MSITIRSEVSSDAATIKALITAAFLSAPHTNHTEQDIVEALRASGNLTVSLVAEVNGQLVGHVALSPVVISDNSPGWYGLGPVAVAPEQQGRGIGSQLIQQALGMLCERGAAGCVVLGEPEYYCRFGFKAEPNLVLPGVPPKYFQALTFRDSMPSGIVSYHESFSVPGQDPVS